jgi:hypothetical protein
MSFYRSMAFRIGLVGGVLGFLHGLVDGSRSWPLIWPALAGAVAFWQLSGAPGSHRLRHGLAGSLTAGAVAAVITFVGATITVMLGRGDLQSVHNASGRALITAAAELGILAACAVVIVAALIGGAVMLPVRLVRSSGAGTPPA